MPTKVPHHDGEFRFRISGELRAEVKAVAHRENNSESAVIRRLLVAGLAREKRLALAAAAADATDATSTEPA